VGPSAREREGRGPAAREEGEKGRTAAWAVREGEKEWAEGELGWALAGVFPFYFQILFCFLFSIPFSKEALKQNNQNKNRTYNTK